jgi:hypothetical protein
MSMLVCPPFTAETDSLMGEVRGTVSNTVPGSFEMDFLVYSSPCGFELEGASSVVRNRP